MNERIKELVKQAGGDFWQRMESDETINPEAYVTFDPPQSLEKFAELIVRECAEVADCTAMAFPVNGWIVGDKIRKHFGVEE